jgi:hypothetical protein
VTVGIAFNKGAAARTIAGLGLEDANRALAEHWLSLWPGDALPPRAALSPAKLKPFLPNMVMLDVMPRARVTVRLAGTAVTTALGMELTGQDWVALAPQNYRAERLRILSKVARGAIGTGHRRIPMALAGDYTCEEILLPFAPEPSGAHPVLVHINWKPEYLLRIESPGQAIGNPLDFRVIALG